jgi:predicted TIM-barrel fold metal-dependent hydrolase
MPWRSKRTEARPANITNERSLLSQQSNDKPADAAMDDKFVQMVTATTRTELRVSDFAPRAILKTAVHEVPKPRFPAIDCHNHLDSLEPDEVLEIMDECGVEHIVNITMKVGDEAFAVMRKFSDASPRRFSTIGWMDWTGLDELAFIQKSVNYLERLVERGAVGFKIWKDLGLTLRDARGELVRVDDERLDPLYDKARELDIPVMFHTADPAAFFEPLDRFNERYEELAAHPDWSFYGAEYTKLDLLEQRNCVFARHPETRFIGAHVGESPENLGFVRAMLERFPNVTVDMSSRVAELGRQPYSAREFFLKFADRILFGTDLLPDVAMYRLHYRFFETADEYFDYPSHASRQGRWTVYGIFLPEYVLRKVYRENTLRVMSRIRLQRGD